MEDHGDSITLISPLRAELIGESQAWKGFLARLHPLVHSYG